MLRTTERILAQLNSLMVYLYPKDRQTHHGQRYVSKQLSKAWKVLKQDTLSFWASFFTWLVNEGMYYVVCFCTYVSHIMRDDNYPEKLAYLFLYQCTGLPASMYILWSCINLWQKKKKVDLILFNLTCVCFVTRLVLRHTLCESPQLSLQLKL